MARRIAASTSPCETSCPRLICSYRPSSTRRARSQASREPSSVTWLPRESATTPSRRSINARFCPYWPNSVEARRLSSKVSTVSAVAVSLASAADGAIPLSVGRLRNASGSNCDAGLCIDTWRIREHAEQAVCDGSGDGDRHHCADQACGRYDLHRLQIGRAAGELACVTTGLFHQH